MSTWPAVSLHEDTRLPADDGFMSRTQRVKNRGVFHWTQPAAIAAIEVHIDPEVQEAARSATAMVERFDERAGGWGVPFASVLLRSESASSSQIERLTASARRVALATLGDHRSDNASGIARNVAAMQSAIALSDAMNANAILAMHEALGGGDDPTHAGRWRQEWVWVGGRSPVTAAFVPPRHEDVPSAIGDLVAFARRTDVEPLTQAALAHAQFETIHPFTDGNGRTGRALVSAILKYRGVATNMTVPISSGLLADTSAYFDALTAYREGDPHPIIVQFADAVERAVTNATMLREDVEGIRETVLATASRRTANLTRLAALCTAEPAFTAEMVVAQGITRPTAYRLLDRLTDAGVLRRERAIAGADAWTVVPLTDALDAFAVRAGRRSFHRG